MSRIFSDSDVELILSAAKFAADKHRNQKRKGAAEFPYINHPLTVAEILWKVGEVRDPTVIAAAVLHDTIEDTETSADELKSLFGERVCSLVEEVTDNKSLPKHERKQLQIEHAPQLSSEAKQVKLADKITNVFDVAFNPPNWPHERRADYLRWASQVVAGLRGCNSKLEARFDEVMMSAWAKLEADLAG
jgi:guanosine-3',5'-bis(diphosphate) 3'-pyrophosphohydrolase